MIAEQQFELDFYGLRHCYIYLIRRYFLASWRMLRLNSGVYCTGQDLRKRAMGLRVGGPQRLCGRFIYYDTTMERRLVVCWHRYACQEAIE